MAKKAPKYDGPYKDVHDFDASRARSSAIDAGKPSAQRKAGPGPDGKGVRVPPFSPGMIPSWDKDRN